MAYIVDRGGQEVRPLPKSAEQVRRLYLVTTDAALRVHHRAQAVLMLAQSGCRPRE